MESNAELIRQAHNSYRDPENGVVVVSPRLLVKLANALEMADRRIAELEGTDTDG